MTSGEKPYYLAKFIDKKWADKLMDGEVFMRAIACFGDISRRSLDSQNEFRGDVLEGINYSFGNQVGLKLTLDNDTFENTGKSRFFERRTSRVLY